MSSVLILHAHPAAHRSRVNRAFLLALDGLAGVKIHDLYERYPDFHVDVRAEQRLRLGLRAWRDGLDGERLLTATATGASATRWTSCSRRSPSPRAGAITGMTGALIVGKRAALERPD